MKISSIIIVNTLALFVSGVTLAQSQDAVPVSANQTAKNEQSNNYITGAVSAAAGAGIMKATSTCAHTTPPNPWCTMMFYGIGPSLIMAGITDIATGKSRGGSIDPTNAGNISIPGSTDPGLGSTDSVPSDVSAMVSGAVDTAKSLGVDPTNPASMASAKSRSGADENGIYKAANSATPEQLAMLEDIKKDAAAKFNVPNMENFTGGGGSLAHKKSGDDKLDLAALMGGGRGPASVDGLSKNFNGNAIGVAGDDIFKQITRRYQSKIHANSFLTTISAIVPTKMQPHK